MSNNSNSSTGHEGTAGSTAGNSIQNPPVPPWSGHPASHYPHYGTQDWAMNPGPSNPHSRAPATYSLGHPGPYSATPYPPFYGPSDAPHGPYIGQPAPSGSAPNLAPVIDPTLLPLPDDDDDDDDELPPTYKILQKVAKPAAKIAGSRRPAPAISAKGKGKQKATLKRKGADVDDEPDAKRVKRQGRAVGAANYTDKDLDCLLNNIEELLPTGGVTWNAVSTSFNTWAVSAGRPQRTVKSLEAKFKQLVRTSKPTGDAECPPHIERAHFIEDMINTKVETRVLDDSEIVDIIELSDDEEDEEDENDDIPPPKKALTVQSAASTLALAPKPKVKKELDVTGPIARRPPADSIIQPRARSSRNEASGLLSTISTALNPATQAARDDERSTRSLHTTQLLTMSQTLRDAQITIESLRTQLHQAQQEQNEANRRADRAELLNLIGHRPRHSSRHELNSPSASRLRRQRHLYDTPRSSSQSPRRRRYYGDSPTPRHHKRNYFPDASPAAPTPTRHRHNRKSFPDASPAAPTPTRHRHNRKSFPAASPPAPAPTPPRPDRRVRQETFFHDGGRAVDWIGGDDDDDMMIVPPRYSVSPGTIRYTVNPPSPTPKDATTSPTKNVNEGNHLA